MTNPKKNSSQSSRRSKQYAKGILGVERRQCHWRNVEICSTGKRDKVTDDANTNAVFSRTMKWILKR
jgi:hypothetical protein